MYPSLKTPSCHSFGRLNVDSCTYPCSLSVARCTFWQFKHVCGSDFSSLSQLWKLCECPIRIQTSHQNFDMYHIQQVFVQVRVQLRQLSGLQPKSSCAQINRTGGVECVRVCVRREITLKMCPTPGKWALQGGRNSWKGLRLLHMCVLTHARTHTE